VAGISAIGTPDIPRDRPVASSWHESDLVVGAPGWLDPSELRIGLGCMRMSTDESRDEQLASETIAAAAEAV
jgi:hypothetical protein